MQYQKSWGMSTKSSSFLNSSIKQSKKKMFQIEEAEEREATFLREKNGQLQLLVLRMGQQIMKLNNDKHQLLSLNSKYIDTLNKQFKQSHHLFDQTNKNTTKKCQSCKCKVFTQFEGDYRNLVKHCINLQQQIKSKNKDLLQLQQIKKQLTQSNHANITELIEQLVDTTHNFIDFKKIYNKQEFQMQKWNQKYQKLMLGNKESQKTGLNLATEVQNYKSLINTIKNESIDKENQYKSKIYSLELTIEKLQKDSREQQKLSQYVTSKNSILKAEQIQSFQQSIQQKLNMNNIRSKSTQKIKTK